MTRREAAARTVLVVLFFWLLGWLFDRWPYETAAGLTIASIYQAFRETGKELDQ